MAVLALLLGLYLAYVELPAQRTQQEEEIFSERVLNFEPPEVEGIWLRHQGGGDPTEIVLHHDPQEGWQMTRPLDTDADQEEVGRLIRTLSTMRQERVVEESSGDLAVYGLDQPEVTVLVKLKDHEEHLWIGHPAPIGSTVYARKAGDDRVMIIREFYKTGLLKNLKDLRRKEVFRLDARKITAWELTNGYGTFKMNREHETWWLKEPRISLADQKAVQGLLSELRSLKARDFLDEGASGVYHGLPEPSVQVTVGDQSVVWSRVAFYPREDETAYAVVDENPHPIYVIPGDFLARLDQDLFALQDKHLLEFDAAAVREIEVVSGENRMVLHRSGEGWDLEGQSVPIPRAHEIGLWLEKLQDMQASRLVVQKPVSLTPYGLDLPRVKITLRDLEQRSVAELWIGRKEEDRYYARPGSRGPVYLVSDQSLDPIPRGSGFSAEPVQGFHIP